MLCATCGVLLAAQAASTRRGARRVETGPPGSFTRFFERFEGSMAALTLISLAAIVGLGVWLLATEGLAGVSWQAARGWFRNKSLPGVGLLSLAILPFFYQIADITNWQRLGAAAAKQGPEVQNRIGKHLIWYAFEASGFWFLLLLFGTLAAHAATAPAAPGTFEGFVSGLAASTSPVDFILLALLVVAVFAIALSTMDSVLSAAVCAFRYDVLGWKGESDERSPGSSEPETRNGVTAADGGRERRDGAIMEGVKFAVAFSIAAIALVAMAEKVLQFATDQFVSMLLAFYSAQLSFLPLIVGSLLEENGARKVHPPEGFALAALILGAGSGLGCSVFGILKPNEAVAWASIPVCLLVSSAVYMAGLLRTRWKGAEAGAAGIGE